MSRGQDQLQEAADACAATAVANISSESLQRVNDLAKAILEVRESKFVKSAFSVPLTAAVSRAAKAVLESTESGEHDEKLAALETAVKNLSDKAGGAGHITIT